MSASLIPTLSTGEADWDQLLIQYPFLREMATCPQEPEHHAEGDVLTHSKMVASAGLQLAREHALSAEDTQRLLFACVFHDCGKPMTYQLGEDGKHSSPKHALKGSQFLRHHLWTINSPISLAEREHLLGLIRMHAWPVRFLERARPEATVIEASLSVSNKLLGLLTMADMQGRICQDRAAQTQAIETARLYLEHAADLECLDMPYAFPNAHTRFSYFQKQGELNLGVALYDNTTFEVTMLSGLPASGKDTWLARNYPAGKAIISRDEIRRELREAGEKQEGAVLQEMTACMKRALAQKVDFAVNATNLRRELRQSLLNLAIAYGARTKVIYLQADRETSLRRNRERNKSLAFADQVSASGIEALARKMEPPLPTEAYEVELLDQNAASERRRAVTTEVRA